MVKPSPQKGDRQTATSDGKFPQSRDRDARPPWNDQQDLAISYKHHNFGAVIRSRGLFANRLYEGKGRGTGRGTGGGRQRPKISRIKK